MSQADRPDDSLSCWRVSMEGSKRDGQIGEGVGYKRQGGKDRYVPGSLLVPLSGPQMKNPAENLLLGGVGCTFGLLRTESRVEL